MKADDSLSKTPSALIERLINSTDLKCFFCSLITSVYFSCLRLILFRRLVSYPTVNSRIYRQLSFVVSSKSGRYLSPVTIEGSQIQEGQHKDY